MSEKGGLLKFRCDAVDGWSAPKLAIRRHLSFARVCLSNGLFDLAIRPDVFFLDNVGA